MPVPLHYGILFSVTECRFMTAPLLFFTGFTARDKGADSPISTVPSSLVTKSLHDPVDPTVPRLPVGRHKSDTISVCVRDCKTR